MEELCTSHGVGDGGTYEVKGEDVNEYAKVIPSVFDGMITYASWEGHGTVYQGVTNGSNMPDADKMQDETDKFEKYFSRAPGEGA